MIKKITVILIAMLLITSTAGMAFADDAAANNNSGTASGQATEETAANDSQTATEADGQTEATATNTAADAAKAAKAKAAAKAAARKAKALKYKKGLAAYIRSRNGNYSKKSSMKLAGYFIYYGKKYKVDPKALMSMAQHESGFSSRAHNPAGYYGIMQTSASLGRAKGFSKKELYVAKNSIKVAASYLRYNLKTFHYNYYKGIAGYCSGTYAVKSGHYNRTAAKVRITTLKGIKKYLKKHNYV
jgi:soluble lytic murein transglycosylase-like protein